MYNIHMVRMKIKIARTAGFCFGVRRAINTALKVVDSRSGVYMLGDIVHNKTVVDSIEAAGIRKISRLGSGGRKVLLIRAHGASKDTYSKARGRGYDIVDATCPMVKEIHKIARDSERKGRRIVIIGDKDHDEVKGIVGQLKRRPIVISGARDLRRLRLPRSARLAAVVQSTQDLETVKRVVRALSGRVNDLKFYNTICRPTTLKQQEAREIARTNGAVIVLGSSKSANTMRLYQISKRINKRTYRVSSPPAHKEVLAQRRAYCRRPRRRLNP